MTKLRRKEKWDVGGRIIADYEMKSTGSTVSSVGGGVGIFSHLTCFVGFDCLKHLYSLNCQKAYICTE